MNKRIFGTIIGVMVLTLPGWADETGFIQVKCAPGVQIFLDGNLKGVTNEDVGGLIIQNVKPGISTTDQRQQGSFPGAMTSYS